MSSHNVVVLAAGRGSRFLDAGITVPKPLLEFDGLTLLERTLRMARMIAGTKHRVILVGTPVVAEHAHRLTTRLSDHEISVSETQPGPAASALLAMAHLPADQPVMFSDCDNLFANASEFALDLPTASDFICVSEFPPGLPRTDFCNVKLAHLRKVDIAEKIDLGPDALAAVGLYGFACAGAFAKRAHRLVADAESEVPMSATFSLRESTGLYEAEAVPVRGWTPVGTPSQLARALS